jgi:hypothetical protein
MKTLILLLALVPAQAPASEVKKDKAAPEGTYAIQTQNGPYWIDPKKFRLGHTVRTMQAGFPIGNKYKFKDEQQHAQTPAEMTVLMVEATNENNANVEKSKTIIAQGQSELAKETPAAPATATQVQSAALETEAFDFSKCAMQAQEQLKRKMRLEFMIEGKSLSGMELLSAQRSLDDVLAQLQKNRGAGGLPCAASDALLDKVSVELSAEQLQSLIALSSRQGAELLKLKRALALAATPDMPANIRAAWTPIWRKLAISAVFTKSALPKYKEIAAAIITETSALTSEEKNGVSKITLNFRRDTSALEAEVDAGLKLLGVENAND